MGGGCRPVVSVKAAIRTRCDTSLEASVARSASPAHPVPLPYAPLGPPSDHGKDELLLKLSAPDPATETRTR